MSPAPRAQTARLLRALFSLRGRLGRRDFWMTWLAFVVFYLTVQYLALALLSFGRAFASRAEGAALIAPVRDVLLLALLWPATATLVRRGHDRGYPAARTLAVWGVFVVLGLLAPVLPLTARLAVQLALLVYIVADYGCTPGPRSANAYGDDPRRAAA